MSDSQVRDIELAIEANKAKVNAGKALERLRRNADFKSLITDGFLKNEAVRLVHLKADPAFQTTERQAGINRDIDAIGVLAGYLRTVEQVAGSAVTSLESDQRELDLMREEALIDG